MSASAAPRCPWANIPVAPPCRAKLKELGVDLADNQLNDVFVRFKALADRKKEVYDDDLIALVSDEQTNDAYEYLQLKKLRVICGTEGPQEADMILSIDGKDHHIDATGDGPVDAAFMCVKMLFPHKARLAGLSGPRGDGGDGCAGDGVCPAGGGRADRDGVVGGHRYDRGLDQGLYQRPQSPHHPAAEDGSGGRCEDGLLPRRVGEPRPEASARGRFGITFIEINKRMAAWTFRVSGKVCPRAKFPHVSPRRPAGGGAGFLRLGK